MARYSKKAQDKVEKAMHEMKQGELKSGRSGKKVTNPKQAVPLVYQKRGKKGQKFPRQIVRREERVQDAEKKVHLAAHSYFKIKLIAGHAGDLFISLNSRIQNVNRET